MTGPIVRAGLRFHARRPAQLALCLLGVMLGVAVVTAMGLAIDSSRRAFDLSNEAVFGRVTHTLEAGQQGIDERLYLALRAGFRELGIAPVVQADVHLPGAQQNLSLLGVDSFAEDGVRRGAPSVPQSALTRLLTETGTVLASDRTAARYGLEPGQPLQILTGGRVHTLHLVGLIEPGDELQRAWLDGVLLADIATAQEVLGMVGRLTRIDLVAPADAGASARLLADVERVLPDAVRLETAAARANVRREMTRAFYLNLRMLSLLALLVGLFIIYNALTFSVIQRRTLIGTLRAVGVSGREILAGVLCESAILGAIATGLGLPLGIWLAGFLLGLVGRTIEDLYFAGMVTELAVTPLSLLIPTLLGTLGTVLAALLPALEATRIPPRAAMSQSYGEGATRAVIPRLAGAAVCCALLAALLLAGGGKSLGVAFLALFLVVAVATLLSPAAILGLSRLLEPLARWRAGSFGALAVRGLRRGMSRSAVAVAALMVALSTTVGVATMVESFRTSLQSWLDTTLAADVYLRAPGRGAEAQLPVELVAQLRALSGVRRVSLSRDVEVNTAVGRVWLKAINLEGARYRGLDVLDTDEASAVAALGAAAPGRAAVLVSEPLAWRHGLSRGGRIRVVTDDGPRELAVAGVFRDYGSDRGMLLMGLAAYRNLFRDRALSGAGLELAAGEDPGEMSLRVARLAGGEGLVQVRTQAWIRDASLTIFDRTFAITRVLQWLATLVACVGVLSALMALALERAREMAVLRAQGLTRRELLLMLQVQTGCMGLAAGLLALPLGAVLALILVHVINRRAFGWGMSFELPPEILLQTVALAVAAALLAGLYPAWRMSRTSPARALREV